MKTCNTCKANKVCNHDKCGFENCGNYIPDEAVERCEKNDYISKSELVGNLDRFAPEHFIPLIRTLIEKQPTADVVEVVRCGKCKYHMTHTCAITGIETLFCDYGNTPVAVEPTHYCSYGERRTDDER